MVDLVNRVNGYIRHSSRLVQINNVCTVLGLQVLKPDILHNEHAWYAGFFDVNGIISYYIKDNKPKLVITVSNKLYVDVFHFYEYFGGNLYFDKAKNNYHI